MLAKDLQLELAAATDVGRRRTNNEDAVYLEPEHGFVVLADGMGGYNAGEVASRMAVEGVSAGLNCWLQQAASQPAQEERGADAALRALAACVDEANSAIFEDARLHQEHSGMGTTLVVALVYQEQILIGHVGDSRAYLWREGKLTQLTTDHSVVQEQLDAGLITPEQAATSVQHNLLTRGLGVEAEVLLDTQAVPLQAGDIYLLCSDGLTETVSDTQISALIKSKMSLSDLAQALIDQANINGGYDNVTVALIHV